MAQFLRPSKSGSYADDEGFVLTGMLPKEAAKEGKSAEYPNDILSLDVAEQESLEYLAGYVVKQIQKTGSGAHRRDTVGGASVGMREGASRGEEERAVERGNGATFPSIQGP
ncbi:hypothetical protein HPB47_005348 [Ixodes persulcatus]|uniref:Uncharacterized protein n=1 Tax=Ixodes persulcatus TaxID=34615 RepID=A0AC60PDD7_IXOPE|nr:hypothetical protein HPB47_005348 [Ixodes persulcatus]